jgi:hypothetical protein
LLISTATSIAKPGIPIFRCKLDIPFTKPARLDKLVRGAPPTFSQNPTNYIRHLLTPYSEAEKVGLRRTDFFDKIGLAYAWVQVTQPQTLGYAFADSPAALLAWIYHKLVDWSDQYPWTDDEILTWVSIYWFARAGPAAAIRIYHEHDKSGELWAPYPRATIPMGVSYFPVELTIHPVRFVML